MYVAEYACLSRRGKIRSVNQDNFICLRRTLPWGTSETARPLKGSIDVKKPILFGVFDGLGGEEMGGAAAYMAADTARRLAIDHRVHVLNSFCLKANRRIVEFARKHQLRSCGTTAAMLLFDSKGAVHLNIGDSRIYLLSKKTFSQLSTDHVLPAYRRKKPPLIQYLGMDDTETRLEPAVGEIEVAIGDTFLICSDGVTDMLSDEKIQSLLEKAPAQNICNALFSAAMDAGGKDNITILVIRILKKKPVSHFFGGIPAWFHIFPKRAK